MDKEKDKEIFPAGLPDLCYTISPYTERTVLIVKGETAFFGVHGHEHAAVLNQRLHVNRKQEAAMRGGVQHGWNSSYADPQNYNVCGRYIGPVDK